MKEEKLFLVEQLKEKEEKLVIQAIPELMVLEDQMVLLVTLEDMVSKAIELVL